MSKEINQKIELIKQKFANFTNFVELEDFRSFLLFNLTSQVPSNILAQMGFGGSKDVISLPYNPLFKIYYQKINLLSSNLIIYVKSEPLNSKFILEKDDALFRQYLNANEISLAFRGKEKFLFPEIVDCSTLQDEDDKSSKLTVKIDDYFETIDSFIAVAEPNVLFVLDSDKKTSPDLIFAINMGMPSMPFKLNQNYVNIDVHLDSEHKTKEITYLRKSEDYKITFLKGIKDVGHSELHTSTYSLIVHVKSLNKPY